MIKSMPNKWFYGTPECPLRIALKYSPIAEEINHSIFLPELKLHMVLLKVKVPPTGSPAS